MFDPVARNRARKKRIWERCPRCGERLDIPRGTVVDIGTLITAAEHVTSEKHQTQMTLARLFAKGTVGGRAKTYVFTPNATDDLSQPEEKIEP